MLNIAIVGATGLVGETMMDVLQKTDLPISKLIPIASETSKNKSIKFRDETLPIVTPEDVDWSTCHVAMLAAGSGVSKDLAPKIIAGAKTWVIDNSSYFRQAPDVPLIIPEINGDALVKYTTPNIVANPNCSTIQMCMVLKPILDAVGLERVWVSTYQSVSGIGRIGIRELVTQSSELLNGRPVKAEYFPSQIAFNVIPQIDVFEENGFTKEEMKMILETRKILNLPKLKITATAARVPALFGHSEALSVETQSSIEIKALRTLLNKSKGVKVKDTPKKPYPTVMDQAVGQDDVYVGRIRADLDCPQTYHMWVVADNVRKGAATNAVQILQKLVQYDLLV